MFWAVVLATASLVSAATAINRPVYKVILGQKGFTQFVQYDVETPPIREFTFCIWLRLYNFQNEQSIFTYIAQGNKHVVRLWLDSGGYHLRVLFNNYEVSNVPVDLGVDTWRHVCLSYQSDFGAWALYLDSRLISCEASQLLQNFVIPGGGSIILGYGITEQGSSTGLEGEIFGANMILTSTIARNHTLQNHPQYKQKTFQRNKIHASKNIDYVVLDHLDTGESHNVAKETKLPPKSNKPISFIKVQTPFSYVKHTIGAHSSTMRPPHTISTSGSEESDMFELVMNHGRPTNNKLNLADLHFPPKMSKLTPGVELSSADTQDFGMLSELETPPPPHSTRSNFMNQNLKPKQEDQSFYKIKDANYVQPFQRHQQKTYNNDLPDIEIPPPPSTDKNVYGHWTSSKYAGNVLNYLKSIKYYNNKNYKVPSTIPLTKTSNEFPYALNFNSRVVRPPTNLQIIHTLADKRLHGQYYPVSLKRMQKKKREIRQPEINVKILKDDFRTEILNLHAMTHPVEVDIIHRGKSQKRMVENIENQRFARNNDILSHFHNGSMFNELPFLKSFEYFTGIGNDEYRLTKPSEDMYAKSLSTANKWHNIKTYNNDYTPRSMPGVDTEYNQSRSHPAIRLKYVPKNHKITPKINDEPMIEGRQLADDVSNHSDGNNRIVSILKYNHGYLPGHSETAKNKKSHVQDLDQRSKANFHKHVKIGNALDERKIISYNEGVKKHSFLGGDEKVPDINRYRSDIDNENNTHVPPSLKPTVCKNLELLDHLLYVHPDGSIKMSRIVSPISSKNTAFEFIIQNYKKCSLEGSPLQSNSFLLIDWNKTPVRLFGGAVARRTTDLCGFF